MTQDEFKTLQNIQMEIMDEVHRICKENSIKYYMIAGTLLGAVRHGGFIPWDMDIDIGMFREDYEKFKIVCEKEKSEIINYYDYLNVKNYNHPHALVCKKNTKIYFKYDKYNPKYENLGIHLDIFPLDNAPDDEELRSKQAEKLLKIRKFKQYRLPYSYSRKTLKRWCHYVISGILSWVSVYKINKKEQEQMQLYSNEETKCVCSMASKYAYTKQCMSKEIYGKPVLLDFSGRKYYAPEKYIDYLTRLYGDYMELPSPEKRKANLEIVDSIEV